MVKEVWYGRGHILQQIGAKLCYYVDAASVKFGIHALGKICGYKGC